MSDRRVKFDEILLEVINCDDELDDTLRAIGDKIECCFRVENGYDAIDDLNELYNQFYDVVDVDNYDEMAQQFVDDFNILAEKYDLKWKEKI